MKAYALFVMVLLTLSAWAQPSAEEIKKFRILKAVKTEGREGDTSTSFWYYDMYGRDSIQFIYGDTSQIDHTMKNGRLVRKTVTKPAMNGSTRVDVYDYEYDKNGDYKETNTDASFGMKSYVWFHRTGKKLKSQSPDGNTITYNYGPKDRLISVVSDGKNDGVKVNNRYSYDSKGLLKMVEYESDGNKSSINYKYDAKGRILTAISKGGWDGGNNEAVSSYEYNEKNLVKRIKVDKKTTEGPPETYLIEYQYEYRPAK
jgi:hypothetical protein